jgi:hypothetical protein
MILIPWNKSFAYLLSQIRSYRNILKIRIKLDNLPVDATVWLKEVCTLPVAGLMRLGK